MAVLSSKYNRVIRDQRNEDVRTISLPVTGALLPGTFVTASATALAQATTGAAPRLLLLGNRDFYDQDTLQAYTSGETGIAYRIKPDLEVCAAVAAATYTYNQELTVGASGRLVAATTGQVVVAVFDDKAKAGVAQSAGALCDVVIVNSYAKA
jgi:hypothetical protein